MTSLLILTLTLIEAPAVDQYDLSQRRTSRTPPPARQPARSHVYDRPPACLCPPVGVGAAATTSLKKKTQTATYPPLELPVHATAGPTGLLANFRRLGEIVWATTKELTTRKLSLLTAIVVGRVFLTDRIAQLNGAGPRFDPPPPPPLEFF